MTERLDQMNQFRIQIASERTDYITKAEFNRIEDAQITRRHEVDKALDKVNEQWANMQGRMIATGGFLAFLSTAAVFLSLWLGIR
jgi:ABC-type dipeptide/oligopeptide/nickel transport system permease subunit